jgi:hypothetical protein
MLRVLALTLALAGQGYVQGIFVGSSNGPIELTAYAELANNGQLRMAKGDIANVPILRDVQRVLVNLPHWDPGAIFVATQEIFRNERAERRDVRFALRRLNITAHELRVEDLERRDRLADLVRSVGGSEKTPAYVFVLMATNGLSRFYPFRVQLD